MHRGGRGDARASCASPLGTPLPGSKDLDISYGSGSKSPFIYGSTGSRYVPGMLLLSYFPKFRNLKYQFALTLHGSVSVYTVSVLS